MGMSFFTAKGTYKNLSFPTDMIHFDHFHRSVPTILFFYYDLIGNKKSFYDKWV